MPPPPSGGSGNERQLTLIGELSQIAGSLGIPFWLRGGWAMDFFLERITRPHEDVDLFVWASDSARLVKALEAHGFVEIAGPPPERQRNFAREGVEFHVTLLERAPSGEVFTAAAPTDWEAWPAGMLGTATRGELVVLLTVIVNMVVKPTGQAGWFWGILAVMVLGVVAVVLIYLRSEEEVPAPATTQ